MILVYDQNGKKVKLENIKKKGFYFIECISPNKSELEKIRNLFDIYEGDLIDSLDLTEIPRVIKRRRYIHIIMATIVEIEDYFEKRSFGIFLFRNAIIILRGRGIPIKIRKFGNPNDILIEILKENIKVFRNVIKILRDKYDSLEMEISKLKKDINLAIRIWDLRDDITAVLKALKEDKKVYELLIEYKVFSSDKEILIRDFIYDLDQYVEIVETLEKDVKTAFDAYISITSYEMGEKVEKLTYVTIFLAINEIIGSFFGMNVKLPFQTHPLAFFMIVSFSIILSTLVYLLLRR